jgi:cytosol alanyl aminopeptidase
VAIALAEIRSVERDLVPQSLLPNYRRFVLQNYQSRAHELGWIGRPGESDDIRLLRRDIVSAAATSGGDEALAKEARELTERWLKDRRAVQPEMVQAVLSTAAYYGDAALHGQLIAEAEKTHDLREKQELIGALAQFRNSKLLEAGLEEVLADRIPLRDGFRLLLPGPSPETRKVPFEFLKAHVDQLMAGNPTDMGFSLGATLPSVGRSFCDAQSRQELVTFFEPMTKKYDGAQHNLDQTLESVDQCVALVAAQGASVQEFLEKY